MNLSAVSKQQVSEVLQDIRSKCCLRRKHSFNDLIGEVRLGKHKFPEVKHGLLWTIVLKIVGHSNAPIHEVVTPLVGLLIAC